MKKIIIIVVIVAAVLGLGIVLFIRDAKNSKFAVEDDSKIPAVGQEFRNQGQKHVKPGESHDPYSSNPPTSGPHYLQPADWGIYQNELPDEELVHNLEHGGIWISYKDIDADIKSKLETIARSNPNSVIITPRSRNDSKIALASWTRLEKLDTYVEGKILEFIKANKNKSPEPIAR